MSVPVPRTDVDVRLRQVRSNPWIGHQEFWRGIDIFKSKFAEPIAGIGEFVRSPAGGVFFG